MTNQLTYHAACAHNDELLRQGRAARRGVAPRTNRSYRSAFKRLAADRLRFRPEELQRVGSSYKLPNGKWIHGTR